MTRVALYARYSSEHLQTDASIEDQLRICHERAQREGWTVVGEYADRGISGASMMRAEVQNLILDARSRKFDVVITEALDRLSRDQEDIAHIYKRLTFEGVRIVTVSEGDVTKLHIGLKGTMNALFLEELARKTHRGLEGRVLAGKSGGGLTYGYSVVRKFDGNGELIRGDREINEVEAAVVRRIFRDYLEGKSPRKIALELNVEGVPGPRGGEWAASTINGNRQRGTGILNNEAYIGILVWDRLAYRKDPSTGKRVSRMNDIAATKRIDVPHLRIIDQDVWDRVRVYQGALDKRPNLGEKRRPPKLFSHLLKCGCCGGGMSIIAQGRYGCSTARNKGTCDNRLTIMETVIEHKVLHALQARLMDAGSCEAFCERYTKHLNTTRMAHNASRASNAAELERVERAIKKLTQSIIDGVPAALIKSEAIALQSRKEELTAFLDMSEEAPVFIHPNMAHRYSVQIRNLITSLNDPERRDSAAQIVRKLIDKIVFTPNDEKSALVVDMMGDLAGILLLTNHTTPGAMSNLAKLSAAQIAELEQAKGFAESQKRQNPPSFENGHKRQVTLVAGIGFEPMTFRL